MHQVIELPEYQPIDLPLADLPQSVAELLASSYRKIIAIEPPSFLNGDQWRLTNQGYAGMIALAPDWRIALQPRVRPASLFALLAYGYDLPNFFADDLIEADTALETAYQALVRVLALRIVEHARQGLARAPVAREGAFPAVRGRLDLARTLAPTLVPRPYCHVVDLAVDHTDHRIMAWALHVLLTDRWLPEDLRAEVRQAAQALGDRVTIAPIAPEVCLGRAKSARYTSPLNATYRTTHALCWAILAHRAPGYAPGEQAAVPWLIAMAPLFERVVARWLAAHIGVPFQARAQVTLPVEGDLRLVADIVLEDQRTGAPIAVLDTKYKTGAAPEAGDVAQIIAYAAALRCRQAFLIYPASLPTPFQIRAGDITVRAISFDLTRTVDLAGRRCLEMMRSSEQGIL